MEIKIEVLGGLTPEEEYRRTKLGGYVFSLMVNRDGSANDMWPDDRDELGLCIHEVIEYITNALNGQHECDTCKVCFD